MRKGKWAVSSIPVDIVARVVGDKEANVVPCQPANGQRQSLLCRDMADPIRQLGMMVCGTGSSTKLLSVHGLGENPSLAAVRWPHV